MFFEIPPLCSGIWRSLCGYCRVLNTSFVFVRFAFRLLDQRYSACVCLPLQQMKAIISIALVLVKAVITAIVRRLCGYPWQRH